MDFPRKNKLVHKLTNNNETVEEFLSKRFRNGDTHLHNAMFNFTSHTTDIRDMLDIGFPVNVTNYYGQSPLHYALTFKTCRCLVPIVKLLVESGADLQMHDSFGHSVINCALENSKCTPGLIEFLVEKGASIKKLDICGFTYLHKALLKKQSFDVIKVLLNKGVDIHAVNKYGVAALHVAARFKRIDVIKELLKNPNINIDVKDTPDGYTPLHRAITSEKSNAATVQLLLEAGANVQLQTTKREHPLHLAAYDCHLRTIKVLLEHGASVNVLDKHNRTPLYIAIKDCVKYKGVAIKALLDAGALVVYPTNAEVTPLHIAADLFNKEESEENLDRILLLLKYALLRHPTMHLEGFGFTKRVRDSLAHFVNLWQRELKSERIKAKTSCLLPEFIFQSRLQNYKDRPTKGIIDLLASDVCREYWDVVAAQLTRKELIEEIHKSMVYACNKSKRASLNYHCLCMLLEILTDRDLLRLLLAFVKRPCKRLHKSAKITADISTPSVDVKRPCKRLRKSAKIAADISTPSVDVKRPCKRLRKSAKINAPADFSTPSANVKRSCKRLRKSAKIAADVSTPSVDVTRPCKRLRKSAKINAPADFSTPSVDVERPCKRAQIHYIDVKLNGR